MYLKFKDILDLIELLFVSVHRNHVSVKLCRNAMASLLGPLCQPLKILCDSMWVVVPCGELFEALFLVRVVVVVSSEPRCG